MFTKPLQHNDVELKVSLNWIKHLEFNAQVLINFNAFG